MGSTQANAKLHSRLYTRIVQEDYSAQHPDSLASSASMNAVITTMHSASAVKGTLLAGEEDAGGEEEHWYIILKNKGEPTVGDW
jgi:hypothetical protein